jgi:hypothetical protein
MDLRLEGFFINVRAPLPLVAFFAPFPGRMPSFCANFLFIANIVRERYPRLP